MRISDHARKILFWYALALSILWLLFIFSNSLDNGTESDNKSASVTQFVNNVIHALGFKVEIPHATIRKLAHFGEFAILSVFVCFTILFSPKKLSLWFSPLVCLACATADELLQIFSEGRGTQLSDVLTDTFGAICGTAAFVLTHLIVNIIIKRRKKEPL